MVNLEPIDVDMVLVDLLADIGASGPPAGIHDTSGTAWLLLGVTAAGRVTSSPWQFGWRLGSGTIAVPRSRTECRLQAST